jgi:hypothetical protein
MKENCLGRSPEAKLPRSSARVAGFPDYHNYVIGFRVVLESDASDPKK